MSNMSTLNKAVNSDVVIAKEDPASHVTAFV